MRRREPFETDEYYHIFNRGVEKRDIFRKSKDYQRFFESMMNFNTPEPSWKIEDRPRKEEQLVELVAYCLNPNHFHFILKQKQEQGITTFMKKICTGYAMYFNKKYNRSGVLFQGRFKSVIIDSNEYLLYLSAYVNCNSEIHGIAKAKDYPWCSFGEYCGNSKEINCQKQGVLGQFQNPTDYETYAITQAKEMRYKKENENLILE